MTVTEPTTVSAVPTRTRTMRVPRSRGAFSGLLLIVLGAWGALIPFIGPFLNYSYGTDQSWHWTAARGWYEVLPGAVTVFGGLLLMVSANRVRASFGGWLAAIAGAWFVVGRLLSPILHLHLGNLGQPVSQTDTGRAAADLGYFDGLGAVIIFLAAFALGRLAVVGVRDVRVAERIDQRAAEQARADELARRQDVADSRTGVAGAGVAAGTGAAVGAGAATAAERERIAERERAAGREPIAEREGLTERERIAERERVAGREPIAEREGLTERERIAERERVTGREPITGREGVTERERQDEAIATGADPGTGNRYEPDRPYGTETRVDQGTTRPDAVGSDYGPQYGTEDRHAPAHQAPPEERV